MEFLLGIIGTAGFKWSIGVILTMALGPLLAKIDLKPVGKAVDAIFYTIGAAITIWATKGKLKSFYQQTFEPWFILVLQLVFGSALGGLIRGLTSDNEK